MTPLRRRMIEDMRLRNLAERTIETYVDRVAGWHPLGRLPPQLLPAGPGVGPPVAQRDQPAHQLQRHRAAGVQEAVRPYLLEPRRQDVPQEATQESVGRWRKSVIGASRRDTLGEVKATCRASGLLEPAVAADPLRGPLTLSVS
jgi:hypothetical protein